MSRLTAVILAAGAGSRLGELGKRYSKPMVPIAGRPLIEWVVERLLRAGIGRISVVGHASDTALADYLAHRHPRATLVRQTERRGIADALRCALPSVAEDEAYLACACDSLFRVDDLQAVIATGRRVRGAAGVGVLEMGIEATATRSAVQLDGDRVVAIVEKPAPGSAASGLVAMPLYWLPREFAPYLDPGGATTGETYVSTALSELLRRGGQVFATTVKERLEVTTAADVERVARALETH